MLPVKTSCNVFVAAILCLTFTSAFAQKEVLYTQYLHNPLSINPAFTGSREDLNLTGLFRTKLSRLQTIGGGQGFSSPITQSFAADGALAGGKIGLGFQALNDRIGYLGAGGVWGSVAYRIDMPGLAKLAIGVQGGISIISINGSVVQPSYGVGIYYQSDRFFGGVSMPEMAQQSFQGYLGQGSVQNNRPLFISAGTTLPISDDLTLIPSVLVTYLANYPTGSDLNAKLWLKEKLGVGASVRLNNPGYNQSLNYVQLTAEFQLSRNIRIGYAFSSETPETPLVTQPRAVHDLIFRFTPNPQRFTFQ